MDKRDFLFKFLPKSIRTKLLLDEEALYSVTDQGTADKITTELLKFVPTNAVITDGTACIGGNTFSFSRTFQHINAVELDPQRFRYLKHNMETLGVENVACFQGDILNHAGVLAQSLLFLDPPWGGPEYKQKEILDLDLSGIPLDEVCRRFAPTTQYIALKTPANFHLEAFVKRVSDCMRLVYTNVRLRKIHLYIFQSNNKDESNRGVL
jgi:16S rRNA G966 N2-methylase RsmD